MTPAINITPLLSSFILTAIHVALPEAAMELRLRPEEALELTLSRTADQWRIAAQDQSWATGDRDVSWDFEAVGDCPYELTGELLLSHELYELRRYKTARQETNA